MRFPLFVALACTAPSAVAARADYGTNRNDPIIVTGERAAYGERATSTATKTDVDVENIPQALTAIDRTQINDQQLRSVGDLLLFVPGASYGSGEGNRDQLVLRGNSSTAEFFVDGVRDDAQYFRDFYNVDKVEVLKGPNAMILGRGGGGGIVNRVLKRPLLAEFAIATGSTDNWGAKRVEADINEPLSGAVGARLNALIEDTTEFRDDDRLVRYGISPTLAVHSADNTRVDLSYEHFHDRRTADRGVPADGDEPLRGFTRTFFGDPDASFSRADVDIATLTVERHISGDIVFKSQSQFGEYRKFYQNIYANSFDPLTNLVALAGYNNLNNRRNLFSDTDLRWDDRLAGIKQTWLAGIELGDEQSRNKHETAIFTRGGQVPLTNPTIAAGVVFAPTVTDADNRVKVTAAAFYAQDQLMPTRWLQVIVGIRFDTLAIAVNDLRAGGAIFKRVDHLWSPRLGAILKPLEQLSIYASYSRSYLPQSGDQFSSLNNVTEALKPERFDNYEVGAKLLLPSGLLATAAAYRLDRTNTRAPDPANPALTVLTGAQRSTGLEFGLERNLSKTLLIAAGYACQHAQLTSATTAAPAGRSVPLVPRQSFSLWTKYAATKVIDVGVGVIARTRSYSTISNTVKLPGYARLDAAFYYKIGAGLNAQLNVENVLGSQYFATANADNNIIPGAPRTVRLTLHERF